MTRSITMVPAAMVLAVGALVWAGSAFGQPDPAVAGVYTLAQAGRGQQTFTAICTACHAETELAPHLFNFATLADAYGFVSVAMPASAPGSLQPQVYLDVLSYLLYLDGFPAGDVELTPASTGGFALPLATSPLAP